jgi:ectoine hydroxylase-related dioxygenase (phytanoyl-CoA dioxygenase family)
MMDVFTKEQMHFWKENGYVVLKKAVPQAYLTAVVDATWQFLQMRRDEPSDWYNWPGWHLPRSGMVQIFHQQSLWNVRQHPKIHRAFSQLFGTEKLWVSLDRVNMNPPALPEDDWEGMIHWDVDPDDYPSPLELGGVLCLEDTSEVQGGFQCVPGSHRRVKEFAALSSSGSNPRTPPIDKSLIKSIAAEAGDLIIWDNWLLHSNSRNRTNKPRLAQYITMKPEAYATQEERDFRINVWTNNLTPYNNNEYGNDPREWEKNSGVRAKLSVLGEKLLGLRAW